MPHIIQQTTAHIRPLADMGAKMIDRLNHFLQVALKGNFNVSRETGGLSASYFGYRFVFRVEITVTDFGTTNENETGNLVAYSLSQDTTPEGHPKETFLCKCEFDRLGNVQVLFDGRMLTSSVDNYAEHFIAQAFKAAMGAPNGAVLKPVINGNP